MILSNTIPPATPIWGVTMNRPTAAVVVALVAVLALAGCGDKPDAAACEAAIRAQAAEVTADGPAATKPAECEGLSDAELEEIGTRVLEDLMTP